MPPISARRREPKMQAIRDLASLSTRCIVGVSGGKDSVAVLELLHEHGIKPFGFFLFMVPGLRVQRDYLDYLRRRYDMEIVAWPHPDLAAFVRNGRYCTALPTMPQLSFREVVEAARVRFGVEWLATGEKKQDSLQRRAMMSAWGNIQVARHRAFPLAEWVQRDVFAYLKHRGVVLAPDYGLFGHSLANPTTPESLVPLRDRYPDDYARILRYYPFAEASAVRHDAAERARRLGLADRLGVGT
jgi:3'-phosphoadenosine 5'-phosphosulfate sulfotransferase (PAPS reductase)/FAD synthetase